MLGVGFGSQDADYGGFLAVGGGMAIHGAGRVFRIYC